MNITVNNCGDAFNEFQQLVQTCDFYTVDQEMTGVRGPKDLNAMMSLEEMYEIISTPVKKYVAFQYGVCLFHKQSPKKAGGPDSYTVRPFNFWLLNKSADFVMDGDTIGFHLGNHMDFMYLFKNAIPYRTGAGEREIRRCPDPKSMTAAEMAWVDEHFAKVKEWYKNPAAPPPAKKADSEKKSNGKGPNKGRGASVDEDPVDEVLVTGFVSTDADLLLHYRLYANTPIMLPVPLEAKERIGEVLDAPFDAAPFKRPNALLTLVGDQWRKISFRRESEPARMHESTVKYLDVPRSFAPYFRALVDSRKPHIGHNYFTDLMFQYHQHHVALPDTYAAFRADVAGLFPELFDTKIYCRLLQPPLLQNNLGAAYEEMRKRISKQGKDFPHLHFPLGFDNYAKGTNAVAHNAAYDAYMTGVVFLSAGILLGHDTVRRYEGYVAQFACSSWMRVRHPTDVPDETLFFYEILPAAGADFDPSHLTDVEKKFGGTVLKAAAHTEELDELCKAGKLKRVGTK